MHNSLSPLQRLREKYAHLRPILVLAPTQRCGSTLLQRALNAGGDSIVYGENFLLLERLPRVSTGPLTGFRKKLSISRACMKGFQDGSTGMDATALYPDYDGYVEAVLEGFYRLVDYYHRYSAQLGYGQWGLKHQIRAPDALKHALLLLPESRLLCIYRDLIDVARSYRARWPERMETRDQRIRFGERWAKNLDYLFALRSNRLLIRYEDMTAEPDPFVEQVSDFLRATVSREVFRKRINVPANQSDSQSQARGGTYIPPAELSDQEKQDLLAHAEKVYAQAGYRDTTAGNGAD